MHRKPSLALGFVCAYLMTGAAAPGAEQVDPPAWAKELRLVVMGGPVRSDVVVTLNGEPVTTIGDAPKMFVEIGALLKPGLNELAATFKTPASPRAKVASLTLEIRKVQLSGKTTSTSGTELAQLVIPDAIASEPACREVRRFWAGPSPPPKDPPTDHYWLFVTGPAAQSKVSVWINERLAFETSVGGRFVEITQFVTKGKNTVTFETQPTCLAPKSDGPGALELKIGPAEVYAENVKMTAAPVVEWKIDPKHKGEPTSTRRTFQAL